MQATSAAIRPEAMQTEYVSVANTAKLVRAALKQAFPGITFSVTSKSYSMGASITVTWVDGPTTDAVDAITAGYRGKGPMDLTDYSPTVYHTVNGRHIHYGADYIHTTREYSVEFAQRVADEMADRYGLPWITVKASAWSGNADWSAADYQPAGGADDNGHQSYDLSARIFRAFCQRPYTPPAPVRA